MGAATVSRWAQHRPVARQRIVVVVGDDESVRMAIGALDDPVGRH